MNTIRLKKGHNIRIAGVPVKTVEEIPAPPTIGVRPNEFKYLKPKLIVKEGDSVRIGSPLFFDKKDPEVRWASPAAGEIKSIVYGERRSILQIIISRSVDEEAVENESFDFDQLGSLGRDKIVASLLKGNVWPLIRQRPFNRVANHQDTPKSIFVSGFHSGPLTVDIDLALEGREKEFQAGLLVLKQLTTGKLFLNVSTESRAKALVDASGVEITRFSGPHPAGNIGIQIHHLDPVNPGEVVWTVNAQHVVTIGNLFLTGKFNPELVVSVGGPSVLKPGHFRARIGNSIDALLEGRVQKTKNRIIGGDVLSGRTAGHGDHIGFYTSTVSVIPISDDRPFLGWFGPGSSRKIYSLLRTYFFQNSKTEFEFNTLKNGSRRNMVPVNAWESMLPMDILPNPLYRSILAEDIDEMENLGILECDEEDFALCSFACPSKINLGKVIRQGLDLVEKEG